MAVCGMKQYYLETSDNEGEAMCALREASTSTIWSHERVAKRTMSDHGPEMSTVPLEAQSLKTLSKMKQPCRILEIDIYTGYGASTLLKGCENATLASLEIDSFLKPWVRDGQVPIPNFLSRRENEVGYALDTLEKMPSSEVLDLLSIEVNENGYIHYVGVHIARGIPAKNVMTVDECKLKDYKNETLASLECVPFLKPWVQEYLTSKLRILSRHEVGPDFDTLEKMHSSEVFDLVSGDANKSDYKDYVEMLIARDLLEKNAMIVANNKSYCGFPSALLESCFLEEMDPKTRSNTYKDRFQSTVLTLGVFLSCSSLSGPRNLPTSPKIRRIRSVQQSHKNFVGIEYNTEMNDDVLEENYMTVYVKTINRKTISIRYYENMTAAVILEEVERRTMIPRDMIRLVHKGKAINGKKSMKENNIKANETIEMSLRLLGGMEANEQMDTHETEEDREKKKEAGRRKRGENDEIK